MNSLMIEACLLLSLEFEFLGFFGRKQQNGDDWYAIYYLYASQSLKFTFAF
jgi:hypothetical protein